MQQARVHNGKVGYFYVTLRDVIFSNLCSRGGELTEKTLTGKITTPAVIDLGSFLGPRTPGPGPRPPQRNPHRKSDLRKSTT